MKRFEGFTPKASWDYKQHSNGYGTRAQYPGEVISREVAEQRFRNEFGKAQSFVDRFAPNLDQGTRMALSSLTYNAGGGWANGRLGKLVRAGDLEGAKSVFLQYNKAGGKTLPGLVQRRQAEAAWFGSGAQPNAGGGDAPSAKITQASPLRAPLAPGNIGAAPAGDQAPGIGPQDLQEQQQRRLYQPIQFMSYGIGDQQSADVRFGEGQRQQASAPQDAMRPIVAEYAPLPMVA